MSKRWQDVRKKRSPEDEARLQSRVAAELKKLPLGELRIAREMTQVRLAELLELDQSSVSKLEHRTDMYISTLRSYIEAMGGELHLVAVFKDSEVIIPRLGEQ